MRLPTVELRRPGASRLAEIVERQRHLPLSYPEVGATADRELPAGYHHLERSRTLGSGDAAFRRARLGIEQWAAHRGAGIVVHEAGPPTDDEVVAIAVHLGPLWVTAACRVVWTVDEPGRFGFAYGTLPHHPEIGEERFVVERRGDAVVFDIAAFSRPADPVTAALGPVARRVQRQATDRYLDALARWVHAPDHQG